MIEQILLFLRKADVGHSVCLVRGKALLSVEFGSNIGIVVFEALDQDLSGKLVHTTEIGKDRLGGTAETFSQGSRVQGLVAFLAYKLKCGFYYVFLSDYGFSRHKITVVILFVGSDDVNSVGFSGDIFILAEGTESYFFKSSCSFPK